MRYCCNKKKTNEQKIRNSWITKQEYVINIDQIIITMPFTRPQAEHFFLCYVLKVIWCIFF